MSAKRSDLRVIGRPLQKVDAAARVTGVAVYADDLNLPRMLHCRILRSPHPHARILSVDASAARRIRGVKAVLTGHDLPIRFGILPVSQDERALEAEKVRYVGDPIAAVAAVDEEIAAAALDAIRVEYEVLEPVMSIEEALREPADEPIHDRAYTRRPFNVHRQLSYDFGDVEAGFARADHTREDVFFYQGNTHLPMEQHSAVATYVDGRLTLWTSTQVVHYVHRALAKVLELPVNRIRVIGAAHGGGFGGKTDPFAHEIIVSRMAMVTGRPVKCTLTREEVFYAHRGRHPVLMWIKTGVTSEGRITAMHYRSALDGGAYGSYGAASAFYTGTLQTTTYAIPAYRFDSVRVFTNKAPCGPKRGHGTPQGRFGVELHLEKIAHDLSMDPVELKQKNFVKPFTRAVNWLRITSCGLEECTQKVLDASGYLGRERREGHGMGFAISSYMSGAGTAIYWNDMAHSEVQLKVDRTGVTAYCGAMDIGQGSDSVLAFVVAEELGLTPADVRLVTADTDTTPVDLGSYSSRVTFMAGNAALEAARKMRNLLVEAVAEKMGLGGDSRVDEIGESPAKDRIEVRDGRIGDFSFEEACVLATARFGALSTAGSYRPPRIGGPFKGSGVGPSPAYSYSACVVDLDADARSGLLRVNRVWIAHDVGRAINPLLVIGQVEGSVYMGLGETLMEEQTYRKGRHKWPSMLEYKSPTFLDTPEIETFIVETVDPEGPYGAKEAGQGPLLPVVPAVVAAVYDALGIWVDEIPITPEKVLRALEARRKGEQPRYGPRSFPTFDFGERIRVEPPDPHDMRVGAELEEAFREASRVAADEALRPAVTKSGRPPSC
ncbi:MAG TPA: molybdopterin cofactor-binding domain-containing protein [Candidatus Dormibacteraeota bacterium]|nr:molybdopterin cofactor-binding domain-containing protein [Candidatus Dormibacteraeota bacterium]